MKINTIGLKLLGGLLALGIAATALAGSTGHADAKSNDCKPKACPDLTIPAFDAHRTHFAPLEVEFLVKNQGSAPAGKFRVVVFLNGYQADVIPFGGMAAGASLGIAQIHPTLPVALGPNGELDVRVVVDVGDEVAESDEFNIMVHKTLFY